MNEQIELTAAEVAELPPRDEYDVALMQAMTIKELAEADCYTAKAHFFNQMGYLVGAVIEPLKTLLSVLEDNVPRK